MDAVWSYRYLVNVLNARISRIIGNFLNGGCKEEKLELGLRFETKI